MRGFGCRGYQHRFDTECGFTLNTGSCSKLAVKTTAMLLVTVLGGASLACDLSHIKARGSARVIWLLSFTPSLGPVQVCWLHGAV